MTKVKLSEVIRRCQTRADRYDTNFLYYVAGEHFEPGEIDLAGRGEIAGSTIGPMFYYGFKPGDFLLVSRNPHLRKASRVDFAGVCSEKTFVLETADESVLSNEYLPWVLQNDRFWNYAQENRHGSTNFFINWSTLADYVFELPSIEEQKRIATILWAAQSVRRNYRKLLKACDDVVKSQFVEMNEEDREDGGRWRKIPFDEFAEFDTCMTTDYERYADSPHIGIDSIASNTGELSNYRTVAEDAVKSGKYIFDERHVIYSKIRPALNKVALPNFSGLCSADAYPLLPKEGVCTREFLAQILRSDYFLSYIIPLSNRSRMPKVNKEQIRKFAFMLPPLELQQEFTDFAASVDKSKFKLGICGGML